MTRVLYNGDKSIFSGAPGGQSMTTLNVYHGQRPILPSDANAYAEASSGSSSSPNLESRVLPLRNLSERSPAPTAFTSSAPSSQNPASASIVSMLHDGPVAIGEGDEVVIVEDLKTIGDAGAYILYFPDPTLWRLGVFSANEAGRSSFDR